MGNPLAEADAVNISVRLSGAGVTRQGFGIAMLLSNTGNVWTTPELTRPYSSYGAVIAADFAASTPEAQWAKAYFAQQPSPTSLIIGKGVNKPTMKRALSIGTVTAAALYKVNVQYGGVLYSVSYTAALSVAWVISTAYVVGQLVTNDTGKLYVCTAAGTSAGSGGPTGTGTTAITDGGVTWYYAGAGGVGVASNDAIVRNLVTAMQALAARNFTAFFTGTLGALIITVVGGSSATITGTDATTITAATPGNWFALEPLPSGDPAQVSNLMAVIDSTADTGTSIATDVAAIAAANKNWYGCGLLFRSNAIVAAVAAELETIFKLMMVTTADTACATAAYALAGADLLNKLWDSGVVRTHGLFHPRDYEHVDARKFGRFLPTTPGSEIWRYKPYTGAVASNFSDAQKANLIGTNAGQYRDGKGAGIYGIIGGQSVDIGWGMVPSPTYAWIDTVRFLDWFVANLAEDIVNALIQADKIAFTDAGLLIIKNLIRRWIENGINVGGIDPSGQGNYPDNKPYIITMPTVAAIRAGAPTDISSRILGATAGFAPSAQFTLAGALGFVNVNVAVIQ